MCSRRCEGRSESIAGFRKGAKNGGGWSDSGATVGEREAEVALGCGARGCEARGTLVYAGGGGNMAFSSTTTMIEYFKCVPATTWRAETGLLRWLRDEEGMWIR
jgi:hypothetical protein